MSNFSVVPPITIEVDGVPLENEIIRTIKEIRVRQLLSAPTQCEIIVPNAHFKLPTEILSKVGSFIQIKIGLEKNSFFEGQITAIEYLYTAAITPLILIRSYDLLHQLRKRQSVRVHIQVSLKQLAQEFTQDMGIQVIGGETAPTLSRLFQYNQSDLQLLSEVGGSCGKYFFLNNNCLNIVSLEGIDNYRTLTFGENLLEAQFSLNAETVTDSVTVTGWNVQRATTHSRTIETPTAPADVQKNLVSSKVNFKCQRTIVDYCASDDIQTDAAAQTEFDKHSLRQVTLRGIAEGDPGLIPGTVIHVNGVETAIAGKYVLTEVNHSIDSEKGFVSQISTIPPLSIQSRANKTATIGIVSQVSDPDNLGRIKVSLPTFNNVETDWLQVLSLGAGNNKGQLIVPDVGDNVLLLFVNNEPSQSIVLGGLYGEKELPKQIVKDGSIVRFVTQTPEGQSLTLDDSDNSIKFKSKNGHSINITPSKVNISRNNGSFISLTNELITIHSESDMVIEAPGNSMIFRASKIDFEES